MSEDQEFFCNFCGKSNKEVFALVCVDEQTKVGICDECTDAASNLINVFRSHEGKSTDCTLPRHLRKPSFIETDTVNIAYSLYGFGGLVVGRRSLVRRPPGETAQSQSGIKLTDD